MVQIAHSEAADHLHRIQKFLKDSPSAEELYKTIVNVPFNGKKYAAHLGLGIIFLAIVNQKTQTVEIVQLSKTEPAKDGQKISGFPVTKLKVALSEPRNSIVRAIKERKPKKTGDWQDLFTPSLDPQEARLNQASSGVGCSYVYPFKSGRRGALIFNYYLPLENIDKEHKRFMMDYTNLVDKFIVRQ